MLPYLRLRNIFSTFLTRQYSFVMHSKLDSTYFVHFQQVEKNIL